MDPVTRHAVVGLVLPLCGAFAALLFALLALELEWVAESSPWALVLTCLPFGLPLLGFVWMGIETARHSRRLDALRTRITGGTRRPVRG